MPANVETAVFANEPAWHREGVVLDTNGDQGITIDVALQESGLDWEVEKVPVFGYTSYVKNDDGILEPGGRAKPVKIQGKHGVRRKSDGSILGVVGDTWQPVQNAAGFQLVDDLIKQAGGAGYPTWVEAAGSLDGGKKVWVMVHLDMGLQIAGEKYASYLTFINGHDGRTSVMAICHDVRIVCQNTMHMGIGQATKDERIVRVRHTVKAAERVKEAAQILGIRNKRAEELAQQGEWLVEQSISDAEFAGFLETLMPVKEGAEDGPAGTMVRDRRTQVANLYFDAKTCEPLKGTRWGAFQAVAEYADHHRKFQDTDTQTKAQFGLNPQAVTLKNSAMSILAEPTLKLATS